MHNHHLLLKCTVLFNFTLFLTLKKGSLSQSLTVIINTKDPNKVSTTGQEHLENYKDSLLDGMG